MKIQVELKGFTPLLDTLVKEFGIVTASVYGIVWRYAQMEDKVCRASLEKVADRIDISSKTAERHIKKLCVSGYLKDITPGIKNKPHIYIVTGKAELAGVVSSEIRSDRESDLGHSGQTESLTRSDRESYQGQTESPLKKHIKKQTKDILENSQNPKNRHTNTERKALNKLGKSIAQSGLDNPTTTDELRAITLTGFEIARVTKTDILTIDSGELKALAGLTIRLSAKGNITAKLKSFEIWWYNEYWLGKDKGQSPTVKQMGSTWGQFEADKVSPANGATSGPVLTEAEKARLRELTAQLSQPK